MYHQRKGEDSLKKTLIVLMALALPFMASGAGWGQGEEPKYDFAYGALVSKSSDQITISDYNFDTDAEEKVSYMVNEWTDFEGGAGLEGLEAGDSIEILYSLEGGQRVAVSVAESTEDVDQGETIEEESGDVNLEGVGESGEVDKGGIEEGGGSEEPGEQQQPGQDYEGEGGYRG